MWCLMCHSSALWLVRFIILLRTLQVLIRQNIFMLKWLLKKKKKLKSTTTFVMKCPYFVCFWVCGSHDLYMLFVLFQVKIWFQNRRMKWRNSKERESLSSRPPMEELLLRSVPEKGEKWHTQTFPRGGRHTSQTPGDKHLKNHTHLAANNVQR